MTAVTFFRCEGDLIGFRAKGHSGYADEGSDIVCAAVSALTQTAEIGLRKVAKAQVKTVLDEENALLEVLLCAGQEQPVQAAQIILRTLEEGILDIERQYPDYVRTSYRERRQTS